MDHLSLWTVWFQTYKTYAHVKGSNHELGLRQSRIIFQWLWGCCALSGNRSRYEVAMHMASRGLVCISHPPDLSGERLADRSVEDGGMAWWISGRSCPIGYSNNAHLGDYLEHYDLAFQHDSALDIAKITRENKLDFKVKKILWCITKTISLTRLWGHYCERI